ncbi:MAG: hypothetical protein BWK78_04450 [Thiotrichaceae bacterium IS1]|nr:MAG: hypothetical protein BWK78_04450 [Thiotrichaceae bacterium IS1]
MFIRLSMFSTTLLIVFLLLGTQPLFAELDYMSRGDRYEGIKSRPVSGGSFIELVSAVSGGSTGSILEFCQLKFYIPPPYTVDNIVVQELKPKTYYWLDKVKKTWQSGFNHYQWPTKEVIVPLEIKEISKLGVVVYLDKSKKYVTPTTFYSKDISSYSEDTLSGYYFTFRPLTGISSLSYEIYDEKSENDTTLLSGEHAPVSVDQPFTIPIDGNRLQKEGFYELLVKGITSGSSHVHEKVIFYYRKPSKN